MTNPSTCPAWCVVDHGNDILADIFHRSSLAWLVPDGSRSGDEGPWRLAAHLVVAEVPEPGDDGQIVIETGNETLGPYIELDAERADEFIRQTKVFLARIEQMRDQLTATKKEVRR
ncbi:DUF6907 domain-containing protein [Streptomyces hygroscopicus]|uniref:DUF6907 domain-containing protein n=1 Tax=Streptomyces hygroscopicus TaxID=1912 RepID=UPI0034045F20